MIPVVQRNVVLPVIQKLRGEPISRCLGELNASQWYSRDRLREMQWRKLKDLLAHAYENVPFYRSRFDALKLRPEEIRSLDDLAMLPTLTKNEIRDHQNEIRAVDKRRRVEHCRSGGTLGQPLTLIRDSMASAYARAAEWRGFGWHGLLPGEKQVRIWGVPLGAKAARRERLKDTLLNRIRFSPFEITPQKVREWYETIGHFGARYIYGLPSAIDSFCRIVEDLGLDGRSLPIEFVVSSAETLHPHQRERIEESLGCRVIDEYGCSEMGPIALECPEGKMHLNMENILVEFVDRSGGSGPAAIVLTNLNSYSMPLLRYEIGDTGGLLDEACPCGRKLDVMGFDAGRVLSMLRAADGRHVSGALFCYIAFEVIKEHGGIRDFRVVQREPDRLEITLVKDGSFTERILELFTSRIRERFGEKTRIDYRFVEQIPLEPSGKRLFVVSELGGSS